MSVITRFAPSPTGRLHVGNIRTALINWLFTHANGGLFMLRLDDTDRARSTEAFAQGIRDDLAWLGLGWDIEVKQSSRFGRYGEIIEGLKRAGRLYACFETAEELDRKRKRQLGRGRPPIYDRAALKLSDQEKAKLEDEGRRPHWRFLLEARQVEWRDLVRGAQKVDTGSLSDPVLVRADGSYLYTLPSVVDDMDYDITHVIRGEDHVVNTAVQIELFEILGGKAPAFGHHNLLVGADGQALSKRAGALSVASLREEGLEPLAVVSHAGTIGSSVPVAPYHSLEALAGIFEFTKLSRSPARFDEKDLQTLNAKLLHELDFSEVGEKLTGMGITGGEAFWCAVRPNLKLLSDAQSWWEIVHEKVTPVIQDAGFCGQAADLLPDEPWSAQSWSEWTAVVKGATGAGGRALFHPLRLALTGRERGPELKLLLPLIGRKKAAARLRGKTA